MKICIKNFQFFCVTFYHRIISWGKFFLKKSLRIKAEVGERTVNVSIISESRKYIYSVDVFFFLPLTFFRGTFLFYILFFALRKEGPVSKQKGLGSFYFWQAERKFSILIDRRLIASGFTLYLPLYNVLFLLFFIWFFSIEKVFESEIFKVHFSCEIYIFFDEYS